MSCSSFQSFVQLFFTDRLQKQLGASPYTIAAYRDAFRLLLRFASERLRRLSDPTRPDWKIWKHCSDPRDRQQQEADLRTHFRLLFACSDGVCR